MFCVLDIPDLALEAPDPAPDVLDAPSLAPDVLDVLDPALDVQDAPDPAQDFLDMFQAQKTSKCWPL